jgi:hypothetical protein
MSKLLVHHVTNRLYNVNIYVVHLLVWILNKIKFGFLQNAENSFTITSFYERLCSTDVASYDTRKHKRALIKYSPKRLCSEIS